MTNNIRPSVQWFAEHMEQKLRENDHKGGWCRDDPRQLFMGLGDERYELLCAIAEHFESDNAATRQAVIAECADVANFALMIADSVEQGRDKE